MTEQMLMVVGYLDLKDASPPGQVWGDLWLLFCVQGLPLPVILAFLLVSPSPYLPGSLLLALNVFLLSIRFALLLAISPSYDRTNAYGGWLFWLSPFSDPLAVIRIFLSALRTPKEWRGRKY